MSNFFLDCNLSLTGGNRQSSVAPASGNRTWHCYYSTAIECNDKTLLPVDVRVYSPMNDSALPDLTVDAYVLTPFPGDPVSSEYDGHLPETTTAYVWALGTVMTGLEQKSDGKSRSFNLAVSEFVHDGTKYFTVHSNRWRNAPTPAVNSSLMVFSSCATVDGQGNPTVSILSITLNVGSAVVPPSRLAPPFQKEAVSDRG
ncbi:hypothetical protein JB92DRAFT_3122297 [Gautieria morchelliformis]|nr:hypothetical protein JB92DRAFT_3122297 [Gautieria morchelliformis]